MWSVQLARSSRVKDLTQRLPGLLLVFEEHSNGLPTPSLVRFPRRWRDSGSACCTRWRRRSAGAGESARRLGGRDSRRARPWRRYVEQILAVASDVPAKLACHPAAAKHAFIWTTIGTEDGIQGKESPSGHLDQVWPDIDPAVSL